MMADFASRFWIVLPLLPSRDAWRAQLEEAAVTSGQVLHDWDQNPTVDLALNTVLLTAYAETARAHQPDPARIVGLVDVFDVLVPDDAPPEQRHHLVQTATTSFAQFVSLPRNCVFDAGAFTGAPLEITPGLRITAPPQMAARTPLAEALTLYREDKTTWRPEILSWQAHHARGSEGMMVDLTGRPRTLVFGPYVVLPAGRWKVLFQLSFDREAAKYLFRIDWGGVDAFSSQEFRPGRPGVFEVEVNYAWEQPSPCEFRIQVREGVFNGQMGLSDLQISRIDEGQDS